MPSLGDSAVIILLGLLLFGPKGLAQIARQLGKLMGEFRRASNEFRMQMEEELRLSEQADRQKEIAAIQAAAPTPPPVLGASAFDTPASDLPASDSPDDHQPALLVAPDAVVSDAIEAGPSEVTRVAAIENVEPLPIAVSGDLKIMPPATGLPQPRSSSLTPLLESIPHAEPAAEVAVADAPHHEYADQRPNRYTNGHTDTTGLNQADTAAEESLHG